MKRPPRLDDLAPAFRHQHRLIEQLIALEGQLLVPGMVIEPEGDIRPLPPRLSLRRAARGAHPGFQRRGDGGPDDRRHTLAMVFPGKY